MKTGLVLEAALCVECTAGALDVLLENDINFDGIAKEHRQVRCSE
ncbi:MAG: hypothetical protein ACLS48_11065 [[Eubacterium] siraeum]